MTLCGGILDRHRSILNLHIMVKIGMLFLRNLLLLLKEIRELISHRHAVKAVDITFVAWGVVRVGKPGVLLLLLQLPLLHYLLLLLQAVLEFLLLLKKLILLDFGQDFIV